MNDDSPRPPGALTDADLIRELLEALGVSQREAARQLGVDTRTMRYYCAGKLPVPEAVLLGLRELRSAAAMRKALVVHPALQQALEAADSDLKPVDEFDLSSRLHQVLVARGGQLEPAEKRGAFAIIMGLRFQSRRMYGTPVWDMNWQPLSGWTDNNGGVHHDPEVADVDDGIIVEWSRLARELQHPVIRARYADLAWEIARFRDGRAREDQQSARPIRPDAENARIAIDAYVDAVERQLVHDVFDGGRDVLRAVELAASIRDVERLRQAKTIAFAYRDACESADPGYPFWLFDNILWEQRKVLVLTAEEHAIAVAALERALALRTDASDPKRFDPHSAQDAADRLGRWRRLLGEDAEARRAAEAAGLAMETAAEAVPSLSAIAILERQAARYRLAGDEAAAARVEEAVRRRAPDAKGNLKRFETRYEVPTDELTAWADRVAGDTFEEGLPRVVGANLISKQRCEAAVLEIAESAPLQAHIQIQVMRDDGFSSAVIGSVREDLDGRAIHHGANFLAASAPFLHVSLARFREKHGVDLERIVSWLKESPLFPEPRLKLVREGLAAWFAEDWLKAIHILVPQIEAAIRDLLAKLGGSVMRPDRHHGGFQAIGLGESVRDDIFRTKVPEAMRFHLQVLLHDPRGINLRNSLAHGFAARELFDRGLGNWMVHLVFMLGVLRLHSPEVGRTPTATALGA